MSQPGPLLPVKPIVSLLLARPDLGPAVVELLTVHFGPPDLVGPWWPFTATAYYTPEMGPGLGRLLVAFRLLRNRKSRRPQKPFGFASPWRPQRISTGSRPGNAT